MSIGFIYFIVMYELRRDDIIKEKPINPCYNYELSNPIILLEIMLESVFWFLILLLVIIFPILNMYEDMK